MYTYPTSKTGTAQDLMMILIRSGELVLEREGTVLPKKTELARAVLEVPFNLIGVMFCGLLEAMPADWALTLQDRIYRKLSGRSHSFDPATPALDRAARLLRTVEAKTGVTPALMAFLSHPPVLGEIAHLNFELVRHASWALRRIRGRACRPRLVAAVDPYALDTVGMPSEGAYAGFMGRYHLGFDRLARSRGFWSSRVVARAAWPRVAARLLARLGRAGDVIMALSGGIPATARILYTVREWVAAQRRRSPLRGEPAQVLRGLSASLEFVRFAQDGPHGAGLRRNVWRMMEGWVMSAAAGLSWNGRHSFPDKKEPGARSGELEPQLRAVLERCLDVLEAPGPGREAALREFSEEWVRQTPYRARLFRILAGRVLARGRPLLFLPVVHKDGGNSGIEIRDAWAWVGLGSGGVEALCSGEPLRAWQGTPEEFAAAFVRDNYP